MSLRIANSVIVQKLPYSYGIERLTAALDGSATEARGRMIDEMTERPAGPVHGRPFPKRRSENLAGRRFGSRNKATMAAQKVADRRGRDLDPPSGVQVVQPEDELSL